MAKRGEHLSGETKKKISQARKGIKLSKETREKMSKARMGKKHSEKTKKKMSVAHKGKGHLVSKKTRKKMSEALKKQWKEGKRHSPMLGKHLSEEHKKRISKANSGERSYRWEGGVSSNKDYISWLKNKRNRMKRRAVGSHTYGEWELLKKQYGYCCPACGRCEPEIQLTEDHIIPLSKGGSDYIENIQPLCKSCNSKKHTKIIKYERE